MLWFIFVEILFCLVNFSQADTPVNCLYEDIEGEWIFYESPRTENSSVVCPHMDPSEFVHKTRHRLSYPNIVEDELGNMGTWTMIYNEGFEVNILGRSYFAFSYWTRDANNNHISHCDRTFPGWSRDVTIRNWSCYVAKKTTPTAPKFQRKSVDYIGDIRTDKEYIRSINSKEQTWKATVYPEYDKMTKEDLFRRAGGLELPIRRRIKPMKTSLSRWKSMFLPGEFDWRNINGVNYISPIRNQGTCGSCYAFASMAAIEARIRILTKNTQKPIFSPQDILDCSHLSQGCRGGFGYLIGGRYAEEQGVVLEECNPYRGVKGQCNRNSTCHKTYTSRYRYVGGYYGATNEEDMLLALVNGGPLMVAMEIHNTFYHYKSGIYQYEEGLLGKFDPLIKTNHVVLLIGYGTDPLTGLKYWIVKNSWGEKWGENGFFRIIRGIDNCGIESDAVEVVPIPS